MLDKRMRRDCPVKGLMYSVDADALVEVNRADYWEHSFRSRAEKDAELDRGKQVLPVFGELGSWKPDADLVPWAIRVQPAEDVSVMDWKKRSYENIGLLGF